MEKEKTFNPGPLGLLGFGMTTILLNLHNAGFIPLSMVIVAMGIAMGGTAQVIAGILSFKKGNTFAGTAFTSYGFFWISLVLIWLLGPKYNLSPDGVAMGFYLLLWGVFTLFMAIATLKHSHASKVVFFSLALLFFLLAIGDFAGSEIIIKIAGYVGIFTGAAAVYESMAQIINEEFDRDILPL